jgi:hypothetical protein
MIIKKYGLRTLQVFKTCEAFKTGEIFKIYVQLTIAIML